MYVYYILSAKVSILTDYTGTYIIIIGFLNKCRAYGQTRIAVIPKKAIGESVFELSDGSAMRIDVGVIVFGWQVLSCACDYSTPDLWRP